MLRPRILIRLSEGRNIKPFKERENFYCNEEKEERFTVKSWKNNQRPSSRGWNFWSLGLLGEWQNNLKYVGFKDPSNVEG